MYFLLTLFFVSLLSITFMIGRKLLMLQNGQLVQTEEVDFNTPYFEEWKHHAIRNIKKHGYNVLVITIRLYFRFSNFLRNIYAEIKNGLKKIYSKKLRENPSEKKEVSRFLKMIADYKKKVRLIKQRVKEEESL